MSKLLYSRLARLRSRRGVASALIILLLVLLVFFGVLSLVTTAADLRLARKRADWNQQYYLADSRAVQTVAGLDQFLRKLAATELKPAPLSGLLDKFLSESENIQDHQITPTDAGLEVSILVAQKENQGQGIQMVLLVKTSAASLGMDRIVISKWSQWQLPFQYDEQNGGIWKG